LCRHDPRNPHVYSPALASPATRRESSTGILVFVRRMLTRSLPLFFALMVAQAVVCQDTSAPSGFSVRGVVVNAVTGQPIPRAQISIDQDLAMLTGSDGDFSFDNVAAGEHAVSVRKPGYIGFGFFSGGGGVSATRPPETGPPHRIRVGADMPALTFPITPLGMITGHVTLSTADPADGIQVEVYHRELRNGRSHWVVVGRARTRSDGAFRIAGLAPGSYMIHTQASRDVPASAADGSPVWGYPAAYYPGVSDLAAAGVLTLTSGQQTQAEMTLVRQQFFPVTIVVQTSSETPMNFQILDSGGQPSGMSAAWDRREGVARASVPNGTWTLEAHAYGRAMEFGSATFQVNSAPVSFSISVSPVPHIPVIVNSEFSVASDPSQPNAAPAVALTAVFADGIGPSSSINTSDAAQPVLNLSQPGRYWIETESYGNAATYVSSITSGGVDLAANPLVVQPGSVPAAIEIALRNDPGTITGQIDSQNPGAAANPNTPGAESQVWVYAIPLFPTTASMHNVMPNSDGQFSFNNLPPGSYRVVACDSRQEIDYHTPEGLAAWAGKGQTVTVDPAGAASVQLTVVHGTTAVPQ
jgi:hypothetical protein